MVAKLLLFDDSLNLGFTLFSACLWVVILNDFLIKNKSCQHVDAIRNPASIFEETIVKWEIEKTEYRILKSTNIDETHEGD